MRVCQDFCDRLRDICVDRGKLPFRDDLIAQLPAPNADDEWHLGTWGELQQRLHCGFCQLVVAAIADERGANNAGSIDPDQMVNALIFPDEHSFRLSCPSRLGTRLAFVAEDGGQALSSDAARIIHAIGIQASTIKNWLYMCCTNHKACSAERPDLRGKISRDFHESATSNFRVIDLERRRIVRASLDIRYVCLSYVWGQLPMFKLRKDNVEMLSQQGGLDAIIDKELPTTIVDAIAFCKELGERYIWVDALCLVQDDPDDVSIGIRMMNSIYRGSYFTIVAGSGADASAGLPGLRETAVGHGRKQLIHEVAPGLRMAILRSIDWHLRRSTYNERGWTLQELVLPRRTVIFINGQVYFRCQQANWCEETWADKWINSLDPDDSNIRRVPDIVEGFLPSVWAYQKLCEEFSRRKLRDEGDALRALAGITRSLVAGMDTSITEGLPQSLLGHFLLFISPYANLRRRDRFASFSWSGSEGQILWPRENYVWYHERNNETVVRTQDTENLKLFFMHNQVVEWDRMRAAHGSVELSSPSFVGTPLLTEFTREFPHIFGIQDDDGARYRRRSQVRGPRMETPLPQFPIKALDAANTQGEFDKLLARMTDTREILALANWEIARHLRRGKLPLPGPTSLPSLTYTEDDERSIKMAEDNSRETPFRKDPNMERYRPSRTLNVAATTAQVVNEAAPQDSLHNIPYTVLRFDTVALFLYLGKFDKRLSRSRAMPPNSARMHAAELTAETSGIPLLSKSFCVVGSLHPDNAANLPPPGTPIELILVSRCHTPLADSALLQIDDISIKKPSKLLWMLYITWIAGVAERRGVAQILERALEEHVEPKPCMKSILLG